MTRYTVLVTKKQYFKVSFESDQFLDNHEAFQKALSCLDVREEELMIGEMISYDVEREDDQTTGGGLMMTNEDRY